MNYEYRREMPMFIEVPIDQGYDVDNLLINVHAIDKIEPDGKYCMAYLGGEEILIAESYESLKKRLGGSK